MHSLFWYNVRVKPKTLALIVAAAAATCALADSDTVLTEGWRFAADPSGKADWSSVKFDDSAWRQVRVPHDWAISGPFLEKDPDPCGNSGRLPWKGVGWYRLAFDVPEGAGSVLLDFDGVMASPEVWVNGKRAGGWDYGYASFRIDATPFVKPGRNQLAVRASTVDHGARWYPGAGIYRRVVLKTRGRARFAYGGVFVTTPEVSRDAALVRVEWETENAPADSRVSARILREGREVTAKEEAAIRGAALMRLESPRLWDVEDPALYVAEVSLADASGAAMSRETVRFGVRTIAFPVSDDPNDREGNGFHLNGRRVQLKGVNNHSDLGLLGMAFDKSAARRQLRMMKDMGANALRTSHNPPAPELLDLCDEMGILVWDEAFDKWDRYGGRRRGQNLEEYVSRNIAAMVRRDRNHPSVVLWSVSNEIWEWDPAHPIRSRETFSDRGPDGQTKERNELFCRVVRETDPTRPVCNGNRPYMNEDRIMDLGLFEPFDVVGWNYMRSYAPFKRRFPKKPVVYSESASAVSSYGYYSDDVLGGRTAHYARMKGGVPAQVDSRDLQSNIDIVDEVFGYMDDDPYVCGEFVWTGFDYLGEPVPFTSLGARSSYFGIVDLTGVPKDRFWLYRSVWNDRAHTLHIAPDTWTFPGHEGKNVPVMVYTDGDEAELFLNGRSLGRRRKGEKVELPAAMTNHHFAACHRYRLMWLDVPYAPGELKAVAYRCGGKLGERTLRTAGEPSAIRFEIEPLAAEDRDELVWAHVFAVDGRGAKTRAAADFVDFALSGPGEILGAGNGDACELVPFTQSAGHRLFGGCATAVIRRTGPGRIELRAKSPTLGSAAVELPVGRSD